jgi:signal transduction histidine kinase
MVRAMSHRVHHWLARVDRLINWFIPPEMSAERESRKLARMFLFSHLFGPFIGNVVPLTLYILNPRPGYDVFVLAGSITAFWLFPFVLRTFGRYNLLVLLSVQNLIFCILWSCYFYGGVSSPTLPWVLIIPLLAFFYIGAAVRLQLIILGLFAANLAAFLMLYAMGHSVPTQIPAAAMQGLGIVSIVGVSLYVTMMAFYYAKILASGVELENEMKLHLATAAELRAATASAERAGAAKGDFLAKMSHEIRTPLNAVIGYSELLLEDAKAEGDGTSAADLEKIRAAGQHLLRLVNQVLELSKIEAGKMELLPEPFDAAAAVREAVESCRPLAQRNGNRLAVEVDGELGTMVGDRRRLNEVICQLVDNAAKFTQNGRIAVRAKRRSRTSGDDIIVAVQDSGIGIAPDVLTALFENFSVGEDLTSTKYGGTGLGLALSQKLCRLMGGEISVESAPGTGSCFTMRVPASPPVQGRSAGGLREGATGDGPDGSGPPPQLAQAA